MLKVLIVFDGTNFSAGAFEFARQMNLKQSILLTGAFLPQVELSGLWSYAGGMNGPAYIPIAEEEESRKIAENVKRFEEACRRNNIEFRVHKDYFNFALPELKKETRFADLMIIGSESFYDVFETSEPNENLKDALHDAECPVIVVPEKYVFPESNILSYDGGADSVFAIKQFAYLFPWMVKNRTILVHAGRDENEKMPEEDFVKELASRHFSNLDFYQFTADPSKYFAAWVSEQRGAILISGAYGRSVLSRMFRKSFLSDVIKDHRLPLFIAHR